MLDNVITWWKGLKWYWQILGAFAVVLVAILSIVIFIFSAGKAGGMSRTKKQREALDELHKQQVDDQVAEQEASATESLEEAKEHQTSAEEKEAELAKIEEETIGADKELADKKKPTIAEIDAWRKKHGV